VNAHARLVGARVRHHGLRHPAELPTTAVRSESDPDGDPARGVGGGTLCGRGAVRRMSHLPAFVRYPSPGAALRHPDRAGAAGAPGREHDDTVHPRAESERAWGTAPARPEYPQRSPLPLAPPPARLEVRRRSPLSTPGGDQATAWVARCCGPVGNGPGIRRGPVVLDCGGVPEKVQPCRDRPRPNSR
jgi:hypothetical protein